LDETEKILKNVGLKAEEFIGMVRIPKTIILKGKLAKLIMYDFKRKFNLAEWIHDNLTEEKIIEYIKNKK